MNRKKVGKHKGGKSRGGERGSRVGWRRGSVDAFHFFELGWGRAWARGREGDLVLKKVLRINSVKELVIGRSVSMV